MQRFALLRDVLISILQTSSMLVYALETFPKEDEAKLSFLEGAITQMLRIWEVLGCISAAQRLQFSGLALAGASIREKSPHRFGD